METPTVLFLSDTNFLRPKRTVEGLGLDFVGSRVGVGWKRFQTWGSSCSTTSSRSQSVLEFRVYTRPSVYVGGSVFSTGWFLVKSRRGRNLDGDLLSLV